MTAGEEDRLWQRLDKWLWCARFMKLRAGCARWVAAGGVRINRQPTDKPHARVRPGDVLTLAHGTQVRVVRVLRAGRPPRAAGGGAHAVRGSRRAGRSRAGRLVLHGG